MSEKPNIFTFATSELSQDAFIAWLLSWANPKLKTENEKLHLLGISFLRSLLAKKKIELTEISELNVQTQFHKIDVFVSFDMNGTKYGIIIEDKVHTIDHNNQLVRYKSKIKDLNIIDLIVPIYFKTGYQVNLTRIEENEYHYYSVKDLMKVLNDEKITKINNDVLTQYQAYIKSKEKDYNWADTEAKKYVSSPIKDWTWWTWVQFFHLKKIELSGNWKVVPNRREQLLAFWYGGQELIIKENEEEKTYHLYTDIQFVTNKVVKATYRLGLNGNRIDKEMRNKIYSELNTCLLAKDIKTKRASFKQAKDTILLATITNMDLNMNQFEMLETMKFYKNAISNFRMK